MSYFNNERAKEIIKKFEGCKLTAYQCSANVWTIGYGNTSYLKQFKDPANVTITQIEAERLLDRDLVIFERCVYVLFRSCNLTKGQCASLISFAFNLGCHALENSTLAKEIKKNKNNCQAIKKQFLRWVYADGKVIEGLKRRREAEYNLYIS